MKSLTLYWRRKMQFKSYAKINIGLRIVGKRDDGFHNIETFFQQIDLFDILDIEPTIDGVIRITTSDPGCPNGSSNLAYRAAEQLRAKANNSKFGCHIHIEKHIPMGAGLGGGSSNAATTLTTLNKLWHIYLPSSELSQIGLELGSDVPFFIRGGFALGEGRGEILTPLFEKPEYFGLLLCPDVHISTAYVYNKLNLNLTIRDNFANFSGFVPRIMAISTWKKHLNNDLTNVVFLEHPEFERIVEQLFTLDAFYAGMSGSGSTLFGLFESQEQMLKAEQSFKKRYRSIPFRPVFE